MKLSAVCNKLILNMSGMNLVILLVSKSAFAVSF